MSDLFENQPYIYESPDGGNTVYRRLPGISERELIKENVSIRDKLRQNQLWHNIRQMAETDEGLQDILERAIIYYNLKRDHDR
jgi:hypothetical protein